MANADLKTKKMAASPAEFIDAIADPQSRDDARTLVRMMAKESGARPRLWGSSPTSAIVGFGDVHLKYPSGRELDWFATGFAPRRGGLSIYLSCGRTDGRASPLLAKLGPHKMRAACLMVKRLADVDMKTLRALIALGLETSRAKRSEASAPRAKTTTRDTKRIARSAKNAGRSKPAARTARTLSAGSRAASAR